MINKTKYIIMINKTKYILIHNHYKSKTNYLNNLSIKNPNIIKIA